MIFDLVDGPGGNNPGPLLLEDTGQRLVNVAITRARGKVIVIANRDWWSKMNLDRRNSLLIPVVRRVVPTAEIPAQLPHSLLG